MGCVHEWSFQGGAETSCLRQGRRHEQHQICRLYQGWLFDFFLCHGVADCLYQTKWEPRLLTTKFIEEAGHVTFMEKPAEFNVILLEWIKDVTKA